MAAWNPRARNLEWRWDFLRVKEEAAEPQKPLFDMLGLWSQHGIIEEPGTDDDYAAKTEALIHAWAENKGLPLSLFLPGNSPISPAEAPSEASGVIDRGLSLITVLNTIGVAAEIASLGQVESVTWAMMNLVNASGLPGIISDLYRTPVEIGLKPALQRAMNLRYQPKLPDIEALTELRAKGMLTAEAYTSWMLEHGYPEWASDMMAYSRTRYPDFSTALEAYRRGFLDPSMFQTWLRRSGLHPDVIWPLMRLKWRIPGPQDIISIYMKEGYLPEKWVEIPPDFIIYMIQQGYTEEWALKIWGQHWKLPDVTLLYDMLHKEIIDFDTLVQMLKYHDYEPVWRQRLIDNAYRMIPRVDVRRAYRYGLLKIQDLQTRYKKLGFSPGDSEKMAGIAARESLDRYYTRLETAGRAAYRKGKLTAEALREILVKVNTPAEAIDLILEAEGLAMSSLLLDPGEQPQEPELPEVNRELITAASALFREGLMARWEFEGYLRKAGLSEEGIQAKLDAEDLRYRLDYAKELITLSVEAFKKDVYTAEELSDRLYAYGLQPDRVAARIALEQLRKLPKPKVTA